MASSYDGWQGRPRNGNPPPRQSEPQFRPSDYRGQEQYYHFGQRSTYHPDGHGARPNERFARTDSYRPREESFSFRHTMPRSIHEQAGRMNTFDTLPGRQHPDHSTSFKRRRRSFSPPEHRRPQPNRASRGNARSYPNRYGANDRPILAFARGTTPEQLEGMNEDIESAAKFMNLNDVSDSSEAEMQVTSGSEAGEFISKPKPAEGNVAIAAAPKWSNPEVFTALPPPDESKGKKRDVVKLIKKARLSLGTRKQPDKAAVENDDFISFAMDNENDNDKPSNNRTTADDLVPVRSLPAESVPAHPLPAKPVPPPAILTKKHQNGIESNGKAGGMLRSTKSLEPALNIAPKQGSSLSHPKPSEGQGVSRKRKQDEVASLSPPPLPKKGRKAKADGQITSDWVALDRVSAIPWCVNDHSVTENMGFWLHKEICDYFEYVKPQDFEIRMREDLVSRLRQTLRAKKTYQNSSVFPFGSFAAGIFLPDADMDIVLVSSAYERGGLAEFGLSKGFYYRLAAYLDQTDIVAPGSIEIIAHAKVPLVKFVDRKTGIRVDLSAENLTGPTAVATFHAWRKEQPAMPIIVTIVKQFLAMRGLNEVSNGGIGGFSTTCLVMSLLQLMPQVQSGNMRPEHHLGQILMEFLDLYGNRFEIGRVGICFDPPGYFDKLVPNPFSQKNSHYRLTIRDPNNSSNDISRGTTGIALIQKCFSEAFGILQEKLSRLDRSSIDQRKGQSLLGPILGGNYATYEWHRSRLRTLAGSLGLQ